MKPRNRILSAIKGEPVDRVPWSPFLAYWWENQKDDITNMGEVEFLKSIGADPLIRGHYPLRDPDIYEHLFMFDIKYKKSEFEEIRKGSEWLKIYRTPVGTLMAKYKYSCSGNTWFLYEHPVKTKEDLKILSYLAEDTTLEPNFARFNKLTAGIGDDALLLPLVTPETKSSFQSMIEYWIGTEELVYLVADYPSAVEETLEAMRAVSRRAASISADSDADAFISWEDTSTTNISPALYKKYILPEIDEWCDILHASGKIYLQHACGHLKALLPIIAGSKVDCVESISPPPTGNAELNEARQVLPDSISLVGGIEPTVLLNASVDELRKYVIKLLDDMKGSRFVLANSDSCPPGVEIEKFQLITEIIKSN